MAFTFYLFKVKRGPKEPYEVSHHKTDLDKENLKTDYERWFKANKKVVYMKLTIFVYDAEGVLEDKDVYEKVREVKEPIQIN